MLRHKINRAVKLLLKGKLFSERKEKSSHKAEEKILPVIDLSKLVSSNLNVKIAEENPADGNVTTDELKAIASLVAEFKPKAIFEIGTFDGRTTLNMAANAPADCTITTLDLPKSKIYNTELRIKTGDMKFIDKEKSGTRFIGTEYEKMITQVYADSAGYEYTPHHNRYDFIFIDGSHSYEYVISDTENCRKLLRKGKGILLWHDYGWHEVVKALNGYYRNDEWFKDIKNIKGTTLAILIKQ